MNRICVITAAWKRHTVLAAALRNWRASGVHDICVAVSPGDGFTLKLCREHDCRVVSAPNDDLTGKFHAACELAADTDCDYFLHMGSDDLMGHGLMDLYLNFNGDYLGLRDWYFHSMDRDLTLYWPGYVGKREGEPIGAGRLVSRAAMEAVAFRPFDGSGNNTLDSVQHIALLRHVRLHMASLKELSAVGVDLKDGGSMTPFDTVAHLMEEAPHLSHLDPFAWNCIQP